HVTDTTTTAPVSLPDALPTSDPYGNTDTNFADTVNFSSSDASAQPGSGLPANGQSLASGLGSFTATLKTAGTQSITATDSAHPAISGSQIGRAASRAEVEDVSVPGLPSTTTDGTTLGSL